MSDPRKTIFDAIKAARGGGFNDAEVRRIDDLLDDLGVARSATSVAIKRLHKPRDFFATLNRHYGDLKQSQVDGFNAVLDGMGEAGWPLAWAAYGLATDWWETNNTMQPVEEAYWVKSAEAWRKKNLRYYPWYGRGLVQLTWEDNYKWADKELGLNGALLKDPALAKDMANAVPILVKGMEQGAFSRPNSLAKYLPTDRAATHEEFRQARRIINVMDKASEIAGVATHMQAALVAGEWK